MAKLMNVASGGETVHQGDAFLESYFACDECGLAIMGESASVVFAAVPNDVATPFSLLHKGCDKPHKCGDLRQLELRQLVYQLAGRHLTREDLTSLLSDVSLS